MCGKVLHLKGWSLENGLSCTFQAIRQHSSTKVESQSSLCMTKHRQQSTGVRAKGIDPIGSQVCSSLLLSDNLMWDF